MSPLIKFDVCVYKSANITEENFFDWATKQYPMKAAPLLKRYGIVKWTQTVQPQAFREPIRQTLTGMGRPDWTVPDHDLTISYWLHSLDDLKALTMDPEWAKLEEEAKTKGNMSIGNFLVGHEIVQFENNEAPSSA